MNLLVALTIAAAPVAADVQVALLDAHNAERARLGSPALIWDPALAERARIWADSLAARDTFDHDDQRRDGENLWMGTKGTYTPQDMVGGWVDEKKDYIAGRFPQVSRTGQWTDVGHYTQLIWSATTKVGCAIRSSKTDDILVCRYNPPGNWIGEFAVKTTAVSTTRKRVRPKRPR
jgi:uncharacterized protein YkwD